MFLVGCNLVLFVVRNPRESLANRIHKLRDLQICGNRYAVTFCLGACLLSTCLALGLSHSREPGVTETSTKDADGEALEPVLRPHSRKPKRERERERQREKEKESNAAGKLA